MRQVGVRRRSSARCPRPAAGQHRSERPGSSRSGQVTDGKCEMKEAEGGIQRHYCYKNVRNRRPRIPLIKKHSTGTYVGPIRTAASLKGVGGDDRASSTATARCTLSLSRGDSTQCHGSTAPCQSDAGNRGHGVGGGRRRAGKHTQDMICKNCC